MYQLSICHLYPDLMNLYGDKGNILSLVRRCEWRGIEVSVKNISIGDVFDPNEADIVFIGGGQDYEQGIIQDDLSGAKREAIRTAIESDVVFLTICGGYQLLGSHYQTHDNKRIECLNICDWYTEGGKKRLIGNLAFQCNWLPNAPQGIIIGFENHSGQTKLGEKATPLGRVLKGFGNNGRDNQEGARYRNAFGTYSHGSLLPKNPAFADYLLSLALKRKYPEFVALTKLDDSFETAAVSALIDRFQVKRT